MTLIIFLIGGAALSLGTTVRKNAALETNQKKAYYIAEAGIEKALAHYPALGSFPGISSLNYAGGIIESVSVEGGPTQYKITSTGHYSKDGPVGIKATKKLEVIIQTTHYKGNAFSKILNVGAIPNVLAGVTAGISWVKVDTEGKETNHYAEAEGIPLEVKLPGGNLLEGLLTVTSTGNEGKNTGGINPENLPAVLQQLGLTVGALSAGTDSGTTPPRVESGSGVASLKLGPVLLFPEILKAGSIKTESSIRPDFASGTLKSSSGIAGDGSVNISLLGDTLKIEALQVKAIAEANGKPGEAKANFNWSVADIILKYPITGEKSILSDLKTQGKVELPGVLKIYLGPEQENANPDGTYAKASGSALMVELLGLLLGGVVIEIGNAEAEAKIPPGGLKPCKIASWKEK